MTTYAEIIQPTDKRWQAVLLNTPHDIYHRPEYVTFAARHDGGSACAFLAEHDGAKLFIPLILRKLPARLGVSRAWQDAVSPYGYASPLLIPSHDAPDSDHLWRSFRELCRELSIVTVFLRSHPILPLPFFNKNSEELVHEGETVFIDLALSEVEAWHQIRENHRRGIRLLEKSGYRAFIDDWSKFDRFIALYNETMQRVGATQSYFFSPEYFNGLKHLDSQHIHLCTVNAPNGEVAAAGLFFRNFGIVQFHLSGTAKEHLLLSPSKLMFDAMRKWSREQGCTILHLGGGVNCDRDSLFNFKAGFSTGRASYHTMRLVCDPVIYRRLAGEKSGSKQPTKANREFFPAYRRSPTAEFAT